MGATGVVLLVLSGNSPTSTSTRIHRPKDGAMVSSSIDQLACVLREHRSPDSLVVLPLLLAAAAAFGPGTFTELGEACSSPRPRSLTSCHATALPVQVLLMVKAARRQFTWSAALAGEVSFSRQIPPTTRR